MKNLLSETPEKFKFIQGTRVKAPLYFGGNRKVKGKIAEGIWRDGHVFYEIETSAVAGLLLGKKMSNLLTAPPSDLG